MLEFSPKGLKRQSCRKAGAQSYGPKEELYGCQAAKAAFALLLVTLSLVLVGCASILDSGVLEDRTDLLVAQSLKADEELIGAERDAALQTALQDWRVQALRSLFESEGKPLDSDSAQAFTFQRGSHAGTVVLLPFGEELLSYLEFGGSSSILHMNRKPGGSYRVVNKPREHSALLKELRDHFALEWLEDENRKRGRLLVPGQTLLLMDDSQGEVVFFVFAQPQHAKGSGISAQQVCMLAVEMCDVDYWGGGGTYDSTTGSSASFYPTTSDVIYQPWDGGGGGWGSMYVSLAGSTRVNGSVDHSWGGLVIHASINVTGQHTSLTNVPVASIYVAGNITFQGESKPCDKPGYNTSVISCSTSLSANVDIPINQCTKLAASGSSEHSYSDATKTPPYGYMSSSGNFTFTFNC